MQMKLFAFIPLIFCLFLFFFRGILAIFFFFFFFFVLAQLLFSSVKSQFRFLYNQVSSIWEWHINVDRNFNYYNCRNHILREDNIKGKGNAERKYVKQDRTDQTKHFDIRLIKIDWKLRKSLKFE